MKKVVLIVFLGFSSLQLFSQPPVLIPIQNVKEQNRMWCWAAVAEQIILYKKNISPKQCELVTQVSKALTASCCENPSICNAPGTMRQIQSVLTQFGINYSQALPMTNANTLYNLLSQNHPIILFLQSSRTLGHCIVLTGMEGQGTVYVNDPTSTYTQPLSFDAIVSLWSNAIVIH